MPLDPILVEDTLQWLRKANDDLRAAQALIDIEPPLFSEVAFHCQQAIEKAIEDGRRATNDAIKIGEARAIELTDQL